jgi:hypothetical protein
MGLAKGEGYPFQRYKRRRILAEKALFSPSPLQRGKKIPANPAIGYVCQINS